MTGAIELAGVKEREGGVEASDNRPQVSVEEAVTQVIATMPRMFRTIKQQARNADAPIPAHDIGETQIWVLYALATGAQLTSELARRFNVTMPTITRMVEGLVDRGYVERRHDIEDRRRIYLELTDAGSNAARFAHEQFRASVARFLSPLSEGQLADVIRACEHLKSLLPDDGYNYSDLCPVKPGEEAMKKAIEALNRDTL